MSWKLCKHNRKFYTWIFMSTQNLHHSSFIKSYDCWLFAWNVHKKEQENGCRKWNMMNSIKRLLGRERKCKFVFRRTKLIAMWIHWTPCVPFPSPSPANIRWSTSVEKILLFFRLQRIPHVLQLSSQDSWMWTKSQLAFELKAKEKARGK